MQLDRDWHLILREHAAGYARTARDNITREFPAHILHTMSGPGDFPHRPAARTPVFFGSLDWHSCVEMHWLLVRLLRVVPDDVPAAEIRALLHAQFNAEKLQGEAGFVTGGLGLVFGPTWVAFWVGVGLVVVGGLLALATNISDDWY